MTYWFAVYHSDQGKLGSVTFECKSEYPRRDEIADCIQRLHGNIGSIVITNIIQFTKEQYDTWISKS